MSEIIYRRANHTMTTEQRNMQVNLRAFVNQCHQTGQLDQKTSGYINFYNGLEVKVCFGFGNLSKIPWISFLGENQVTMHGIYVVLLYYRELRKMALCYGVSEQETPDISWNFKNATPQTTGEYLKANHLPKQKKYNSSFVYKVFSIDASSDFVDVVQALEKIIPIYKATLRQNGLRENVNTPVNLVTSYTGSYLNSSYATEPQSDDETTQNNKFLTQTFLLTWNPKHFKWDDEGESFEDDYNTFKSTGEFESRWSSGSNKSIKKGDRLFLMRLGEDPKGIILSGYATCDVFQDDHWDDEKNDAGAKANFINIKVDKFLDYTTENILSLDTLNNNIPGVAWTPQGSGQKIPADKAKILENLWKDTDTATQEENHQDMNSSDIIENIISAIKSSGLLYDNDLIKRFAYSLMTKPFVILSGLAGSGKTQLALAFAKALVEDESKQLCVVPVGADWTNREPLLGYPNAIKENDYVRPDNSVLDLLIECNKNSNKPYFLILDEMNLSYVERYFADFLSAMESHEPIPLWKGTEDVCPNTVMLPKNLFIIGTINVDETTYMFSPKVLDRANVIEFKVSEDEMSAFLDAAPSVDMNEVCHKAASSASDFVNKAGSKVQSTTVANESLKEFFKQLKKVNAEFGYRSAVEIGRFISLAKEDLGDDKAIDAAIVQKLMPKLHGSRKKIIPVLKELWKLCGIDVDIEEMEFLEVPTDVKYPLTADKIVRMYKGAMDNGFTSFAEA